MQSSTTPSLQDVKQSDQAWKCLAKSDEKDKNYFSILIVIRNTLTFALLVIFFKWGYKSTKRLFIEKNANRERQH